MKKITILLVLAFAVITWSCENSRKTSLLSPDGKINFEIDLSEDDSISTHYSVKYMENENEYTVIEKSPLGVDRVDGDFSHGLKLVGVEGPVKIDESYTMIHGKSSTCHNLANELVYQFKNKKGQQMHLACRAYNDGIAFQYRFPETSGELHEIAHEYTGFKIPAKAKAWLQTYDTIGLYGPGYETYWTNGIPAGTTSPEPGGWAFPALFQTGHAWLLVTESGLDESYCGTHLQPECPDGLYTIRYPEKHEWNDAPVMPSSTLPWNTPWRAVIISRDQGGILESNLVTHLAKPCEIKDPSWVKPGISSWSWWSDHQSPVDYDKLANYVDLAAEMNWEYSLVDAEWHKMKGGDIEKLADYANSKDVGLILWYNSGGDHNLVKEGPRDIMNNPGKRKKEFKWMQKIGIKGIKVDFMLSDKQETIKLYLGIIKDAADHGILVNFHGCTIPRGWRRTYPNLVTMESVQGAEHHWSEDFARFAPVHHTIIPFSRNVIGPMDYTPVTYTDDKVRHITTWAHETALSVLFESGIVHMADRASAYRDLNDTVKEFLQTLPASWDQTIHLEGVPGDKLCLARKKGGTWYVAGVNGQKEERTLKFYLDFLDEGQYLMNLITDGEVANEFGFKTETVDRSMAKKVSMLPSGGFVAKIEKKD